MHASKGKPESQLKDTKRQHFLVGFSEHCVGIVTVNRFKELPGQETPNNAAKNIRKRLPG
jgi:hypothetical protein